MNEDKDFYSNENEYQFNRNLDLLRRLSQKEELFEYYFQIAKTTSSTIDKIKAIKQCVLQISSIRRLYPTDLKQQKIGEEKETNAYEEILKQEKEILRELEFTDQYSQTTTNKLKDLEDVIETLDELFILVRDSCYSFGTDKKLSPDARHAWRKE